MCFLLRLLTELGLEHVSGRVRPETHCTIRRASRNKFLLDTHVESMNLLGVERCDQMFILLALIGTTQVNHDLDQLARARREHDCVLLRRQRQSCDLGDVDILVDHLAPRMIVPHRRWNQVICRVHSHVRLLDISLALDEHSESSTVTGDDEAAFASAAGFAGHSGGSTGALDSDSTERGHRVDWEEVLPRVTDCQTFVLTRSVEKVNLTMISADDKATIIEPSMACVVVRVVRFSLSLVDEVGQGFQGRTVELNIAVKLLSSDNDHRWVNWAE